MRPAFERFNVHPRVYLATTQRPLKCLDECTKVSTSSTYEAIDVLSVFDDFVPYESMAVDCSNFKFSLNHFRDSVRRYSFELNHLNHEFFVSIRITPYRNMCKIEIDNAYPYGSLGSDLFIDGVCEFRLPLPNAKNAFLKLKIVYDNIDEHLSVTPTVYSLGFPHLHIPGRASAKL